MDTLDNNISGSHLRLIYSRKDLRKIFGNEYPSITEREQWFAKHWRRWRNNSLKYTDTNQRFEYHLIKDFIRKNLKPFEIVIRGKEIRFKNKSDMVFLKLKFNGLT